MENTIKQNGDTGLSKILLIALPVTLQNMIATGLGFVDVFMIGMLGDVSITAVGICNQYFFIYMITIFGISSGAQIYLAQYWGDQNLKDFHRAMGVSVLPSIVTMLIFFLPAFFTPSLVMSFFSKDPEVIKQGADYLRIASFAYPFHVYLQLYATSFRSCQKASIPMIITAVSLLMNTALNYLLILGNYGFPRLEVEGAAIATVVSTAFGALVVLGILKWMKTPVKASLKEHFDFDFSFFKKIVKSSTPIAMNEMMWALGTALIGLSFSRYSTSAYAAYQIFNIIFSMAFTFGIGLAISDSILIGNMLGEGRLEEATMLERKYTKLTFAVSIVCGIGIYLLADLLVGIFTVGDYVSYNAKMMIRVGALFIPLKFYTLLHLVGTLRAGGDSLMGVIIDVGTLFLVGVPMAFLSLHYMELSLYLALATVYSEEIFKTVLSFLRVKQRKWVRNLVS